MKLNAFVEFYNTKTPIELYHMEIRVIDKDYDVELNGVLINTVKGIEDTLIFVMPNNRRIRLRITDDTRILVNGKEVYGEIL